MLLSPGTGNILQFDCASAGSIRAECSFILVDQSTPPVVQNAPGNVTIAAVTGATANTTLKAGTASRVTRVTTANFYNDHASVANVVTVKKTDGTNATPIVQANLLPGESLFYTGSVWVHYDTNGVPVVAAAKLDAKLRVVNDVTNATTSFANVTGLTAALKSGKTYNFEAHLYHISNATTTGAQFGYNIGAAPTVARIQAIDVILGSLTTATMGSSTTDVTARDTAAMAETTGAATVVLCILSGYIQPSADGTFAIRCASEVAVASGLIVKAGSWLRIWETDS